MVGRRNASIRIPLLTLSAANSKLIDMTYLGAIEPLCMMTCIRGAVD